LERSNSGTTSLLSPFFLLLLLLLLPFFSIITSNKLLLRLWPSSSRVTLRKPQKLETLKRVNLNLLFERGNPKLAIWNVSVLITDRRVSTKKKIPNTCSQAKSK
jgi:hypothetical protein